MYIVAFEAGKVYFVELLRNPNNKTDEFWNDVDWRPLQSNISNYLEIGNKLTMKTGLYEERYRVWDKLFPSKQNLAKNGGKWLTAKMSHGLIWTLILTILNM